MEYVMKYNFDEVVERRGTGCLKYDLRKNVGKRRCLAVMGCRYGF